MDPKDHTTQEDDQSALAEMMTLAPTERAQRVFDAIAVGDMDSTVRLLATCPVVKEESMDPEFLKKIITVNHAVILVSRMLSDHTLDWLTALRIGRDARPALRAADDTMHAVRLLELRIGISLEAFMGAVQRHEATLAMLQVSTGMGSKEGSESVFGMLATTFIDGASIPQV